MYIRSTDLTKQASNMSNAYDLLDQPAGELIIPDGIPNDATSDDDSGSSPMDLSAAAHKDCRHFVDSSLECKFGDECIFRHGKRDQRPICFGCEKRRIPSGVERCAHCTRVKAERAARFQAKKQKRDRCVKCGKKKLRTPGGGPRDLYCPDDDKLHDCCSPDCKIQVPCRREKKVQCRDCNTTHTCKNPPSRCRDLNLDPARYSCGYCHGCYTANWVR